MAHTSTLHVKIDPLTDEHLQRLAAERKTSKSQLVREAISACYQTAIEDLPVKQRRAIAAYQGGFISIGRLAEVMGMHVLELRDWLREHDIAQNSTYAEQDVTNA